MSLSRAHQDTAASAARYGSCLFPQRDGLCCSQFYFNYPRQLVRILGMLEGVIHIVLLLLQGQRSDNMVLFKPTGKVYRPLKLLICLGSVQPVSRSFVSQRFITHDRCHRHCNQNVQQCVHK